jgi:hypothetical protein
MVNNVLQAEKDSRHVEVYINDILVHMENEVDNWYWTGCVLAMLTANKLFMGLKKCSFEKSEVLFLGMIIRKGEVGVSPDKVKAILNEKPPTSKKGVQCFLGITNYHRRFIKDYTRIARCYSKRN